MKNIKVGDTIFFERGGSLIIDIVKEIAEIDGKLLITTVEEDDWYAPVLTEDDLLDENDERVKRYKALREDKMIKLSDARSWLQYHLRNYYEADEWSEFNDEQAIKDFCIAMFK